jgi:gliding motility-associated-like protein
MAATGAGTWSAQTGNPGTATITNNTLNTTTITTYSAPGTYHFIWTNADGCTDTANVIVTAKPDAGIDQSVLCTLIPGGTATMAGTGTGTWSPQTGNPGFATIVTPTSPTTSITNFSASGTYSFIWTNASGCTDTATILVTEEPTITLPNYAYCLGGSATLIPTVAPAGGTYLWSTTETSATITVNPTVTTSFTVTYTLGSCSASAIDTVTVNPLPLATVTTIPSVCTANNGIAIANPSAGTPGYTYSWSSPGGTGDSVIGVAPGSYTVTVTDINHCTVIASGTVGLQTPAIIVNEVSQHDLKCFNDNTGEVYITTIDTARNSGPYVNTYNWSNSTHNQNLTGAPAGTFTVQVTDQFGCTGSGTYTLTQPVALSATTSFVNPHCFGYADGTATVVNPAGGSGAYHYAWSTSPVQNTQTATALTANTYTVALSDDSACVLTLTVTLTDPLAITFADSTILNPNCNGDSNGTALVAPQNGIGSYTYAWSYNGEVSNPAINLPDGTYTVVATDGNGCSGTTTVKLIQPTPVSVTPTPINVTCFGYNNGSATAVGAGGTAPYTYLWNTSDSTATASNLVAGLYTVRATDSHGCTASNTTNVTEPTKVLISLTSIRTNCPDSKDGTISASATGGTGSYTYTLKDTSGIVLQAGNTSGNFAGLGYGPYIVEVQDQNNCPAADIINVPRAPFNYYTYTADTVSCYGPQYHDGIIRVQGYTIPNGPFSYSVDGSPFQTIPDFFDLAAGPHLVTAQDNYGCDTTFTVIVGEPLPAVLEILPGDSTITPGTALQLSTSFGPYPIDSIKQYEWTPVTGLNCTDCAGPIASPYDHVTDYTLVVTYNRGCTVSASIRISTDGTPPVFVPNAFTPNGDGVDDIWSVFGTGIKDFRGTVFNRWGEKVFESDNQSDGWDGTFRGQRQPPGVYVYIVDLVYLNGEKVTKQGSITLIR